MPFNQPSRSDVHVDGPLSSVSVAYMQSADTFVADRAFPRLGVSKQSDVYFTYDRGYFNRAEMKKRAPSTESAGATYAISTDSYLADVWALHRDIADQVRANADSPIKLDTEAAEFLTLQGLLRREKEWADAHFVTGAWTSEVTGVSDHPDIVGRLDRGQTSGPAIVLRDALAALFELSEILVMDAIENTANEGATNVHAFIGGKHALLLYTPATPGLMTPSAGYTFTWTGLLGGGALGTRISRMRVELRKADRVEIEMAFDQKQVAADLGYFFLTAVS